jgi:antitoxin VapB
MIEQTERHVRLFRNGRNQAVRIPREFELPGDEAILRRDEAGRLVLEAVRPTTLKQLLDAWKKLPSREALPEIEDLPAEPVDL